MPICLDLSAAARERAGLGRYAASLARARLTGFVPDEDLPALINCAEVLAYPSTFEGFGLPPLEAMACGVPVVCSNASSLPEVVNDAGLLLSPHEVCAWVEALSRLLSNSQQRADLRARGLARARRFTWEATAQKTFEVYQSVLHRWPAVIRNL